MKLSITKDDLRPKLNWLFNSNEIKIDLLVPEKRLDLHYDLYLTKIEGLTQAESYLKWQQELNANPIETLKKLIIKELLPYPLNPDPAIQSAHEIEHRDFLNKFELKLRTILNYLKELII
jgi:hypothetical protein